MAAHRRTASNDHVRVEINNQSDQDHHAGGGPGGGVGSTPSDDSEEVDLNDDEHEVYLTQLLVPNGSYNGN